VVEYRIASESEEVTVGEILKARVYISAPPDWQSLTDLDFWFGTMKVALLQDYAARREGDSILAKTIPLAAYASPPIFESGDWKTWETADNPNGVPYVEVELDVVSNPLPVALLLAAFNFVVAAVIATAIVAAIVILIPVVRTVYNAGKHVVGSIAAFTGTRPGWILAGLLLLGGYWYFRKRRAAG